MVGHLSKELKTMEEKDLEKLGFRIHIWDYYIQLYSEPIHSPILKDGVSLGANK